MSATDVPKILARRLQAVEDRIAAACRRAGRARGDVTLVAVTKTVAADVARVLHQLGAADLGENRPQALWTKAATLPQTVRWHMVGHLQRNKVERTLPLVHMIHSVDSVRLLEAVEGEAERQSMQVDVLLEVNASREATKHGFAVAEVPGLLPRIHQFQFVRVCGLMTMAAPEADPQRCRPTFAELRQLREKLQRETGPHEFRHLSMGMSNDFEVAIEEGATLIRLGTVLFEGLTGKEP
jgi:hypothetical protein